MIAVAGDTLEIDEETYEVIVNGKKLNETYAIGVTMPIEYNNEYKDNPIPEGYLFVMGDNREMSRDSRDMSEIGLIREEDIIGKALFSVLPLTGLEGCIDMLLQRDKLAPSYLIHQAQDFMRQKTGSLNQIKL